MYSVNSSKSATLSIIRQDVDYPMYLVEWWSAHAAYKPGNENGPWRQCWTYIGTL